MRPVIERALVAQQSAWDSERVEILPSRLTTTEPLELSGTATVAMISLIPCLNAQFGMTPFLVPV